MRLIALLMQPPPRAGRPGRSGRAPVEIKDAVARSPSSPRTGNDIRSSHHAKSERLPLKIRQAAQPTVIDGGLERREDPRLPRQRRQRRGPGRRRRRGRLEDMPQMVVRTPARRRRQRRRRGVRLRRARSASLDLGNAGCGDWTVANVEGRLQDQPRRLRRRPGRRRPARRSCGWPAPATSPPPRSAARSTSTSPGSGDVRGQVDVGPAGRACGRLRRRRGAGGQASAMTVSVAGSGNVVSAASPTRLKARIAGSGDVRARQVRGEVRKTVMGSGGGADRLTVAGAGVRLAAGRGPSRRLTQRESDRYLPASCWTGCALRSDLGADAVRRTTWDSA